MIRRPTSPRNQSSICQGARLGSRCNTQSEKKGTEGRAISGSGAGGGFQSPDNRQSQEDSLETDETIYVCYVAALIGGKQQVWLIMEAGQV